MPGQHKRDFKLVAYQSEWAELFSREAKLLQSTLGSNCLRIEHIGSTSIPRMPAKAIIDIMVAIPSLKRSSDLILGLDEIGYTYKPFDTIPDRMFFAKESLPEVRTHHLSVVVEGSGFWDKHLLFRDQLRSNDQLASEYIEVKKSFADHYARTKHLDVEWKSAFVKKVLQMARDELS